MQLRTSTWARRSHKILTTSPSKKGFDQNRYAFQNTAGVYHHICMPVLSANTCINHFSIDVCLHPMELVRRPNIFIQEGVWSNSVIRRDSESTPEYCWCIASHCYACCLPIKAYTCEPTFNGVDIFIQERVWSNPVIQRDSVSTPEYFWCIASHCYAYCLPIQAYTCDSYV